MNALVPWTLWLAAAVPAIPLAWFTIEVLLGLRTSRQEATPNASASVAVLIPAHDEEQGIAATVAALKASAPAATRIIVVADNCSDKTAQVARDAGAEVISRRHDSQRGKGYALAFGRDHLALSPPAVVIVLDADCRLAPGSIEALAGHVLASNMPGQAVDVIEPDLAAGPLVQISSFAMLVKNLVRLRGMGRIGGCSLLCGTGMAFPWQSFAAAKLASGDLVEDLGLTIAMIRSGLRPRLVESAMVVSKAAGVAESVAQRSRWEHGFLATASRHAVPAVVSGLCRLRRADFALGMHLLVPPLALLFALAGTALVLVGLGSFAAGIWTPFQLLAATLALASLAVTLAWLKEGRATLSGGSLLRAPLYVLWKLPIYLKFLSKRETSWVRTARDGEQN